MSGPLVAGLEIGGTKCIAILGRGPGDVVEQTRVHTGEPEATLAALEAALRRWHRRHGFAALGIASFGPLSLDPTAADYGRIVSTPKAGWSGTDLIGRWQNLGIPVALQTDVVGAALAEGRWGAAQGLADHAYITVGTGIGVGPIVGGEPIAGRGHCELGHARVPRLTHDDWPGCCPFHGDCAEGLASGAAIRARAGVAAPDKGWEGWASVEYTLAMLLHNLFMTLQPRRIVVGGGVIEGRPATLDGATERMWESFGGYHTGGVFDPALVVRPQLGAMAGPLGAIALGLNALSV